MSSSLHPATRSALLYCILDLGYVPEGKAVAITSELIAGGADIVQLRAKGYDLETIARVGRAILPLCRSAGIPFILNDYPALAAELDADGVHLGQDDGPLQEAREILGFGKIIGRSTHSLDQARAALAEYADYIGFGPLFPTPTKPGRPALGLDSIAAMESEVGSKIPAFCIGGINLDTLPAVLAAGASRAVVVSALLQSPDIPALTRTFRSSLAARSTTTQTGSQ